MYVTRTAAVGLAAATVWAGGAATFRDVAGAAGHDTPIPADAGPTGGTIIHSAATIGYFALDQRSPVDPTPQLMHWRPMSPWGSPTPMPP